MNAWTLEMLKRFLLIFGMVTMLVLSFTIVGAAAAQVQEVCYLSGLYNIPIGSSMTSIIYDPGTGTVYFQRTLNGGQSDPYNALLPVIVPITAIEDTYVDGVFNQSFAVPDYQLPLSDCVGGFIGDGRINDGPNELGAPLAAYCAEGDIEVWDINLDAQGTLGFTASASAIDDALSQADSSGLPTLIDSGLGNNLYASPDGELVVQGPDLREPGKLYSFSFSGDRCG
jgi:hypothetical protein